MAWRSELMLRIGFYKKHKQPSAGPLWPIIDVLIQPSSGTLSWIDLEKKVPPKPLWRSKTLQCSALCLRRTKPPLYLVLYFNACNERTHRADYPTNSHNQAFKSELPSKHIHPPYLNRGLKRENSGRRK